MAGKPISIYVFCSGALLRLSSLHKTYETCVFARKGVGTYLKWLPWWLLFIRILPWRVPSQHWWYPNPVSRFGFLVSWSQISDNTNPGLASPRVYFKFSGHDSLHFSRQNQKLKLAAQRILDSKSATIREVAQLISTNYAFIQIRSADISWWIRNALTSKRRTDHGRINHTLYTDASTQGWGASLNDTTIWGRWSSSEESHHNNFLELKASLLGLQSLCKEVSHDHIRVT